MLPLRVLFAEAAVGLRAGLLHTAVGLRAGLLHTAVGLRAGLLHTEISAKTRTVVYFVQNAQVEICLWEDQRLCKQRC